MPDDKLVERLWLATKHGDENHQAWLREAYTAFFAGYPVPEPRGRGNKEARIAELEAALQSERASMEERLAETQMRAFKWMEAHDKLKAGKPYDFPKPADLPDALASMEGEIERVNEIIADKLCPIFGPGPYETLAREIVAALISSKTGDE